MPITYIDREAPGDSLYVGAGYINANFAYLVDDLIPTLATQSQITTLTTSLAGKASTSHTHLSTDITDSTETGRSVLTVASLSALQTLLGLTAPTERKKWQIATDFEGDRFDDIALGGKGFIAEADPGSTALWGQGPVGRYGAVTAYPYSGSASTRGWVALFGSGSEP